LVALLKGMPCDMVKRYCGHLHFKTANTVIVFFNQGDFAVSWW
jgi:hypothetical protein